MNIGQNANRAFSLLLAASMLFSGGAFQPIGLACGTQSCNQDCCCSSLNSGKETISGCCSRKNTKSRSCCHRSADQPRKATCCKVSQQPEQGCRCQCRQQSPTPICPERGDTARRQFEQLLVQQLWGMSLDIPLTEDSDACDVSDNLTTSSTPSAQTLLCVWLT